MDFYKFDKIDKIFICFVLIFVTLFCVFQTFGLCAENVSFDIVEGLAISDSRNFFVSGSTNVGYFSLERGYKYTFTNYSGYVRHLALSNDIPELNVTYTYLVSVEPGESYEYITYTNDYLYFDFSSNQNVVVTRELISGQQGAVDSLVNNVGISQLWSIFDVSIPFILVVVLVAIGLFIIFSFIKRGSKGKSGF